MRYASTLFFAFVVLSFGFFACQTSPKGRREPPKQGSDDGQQNGASLSWDGHFKEWFDDNCNSCHGKGGTQPYLYTYSRVKRFSDEWLESVEDGRMPKGQKASNSDIKDLKKWVSDGLPEEETKQDDDRWKFEDEDDDDDNEGANLTYEGEIKAIIDRNCVTCHGSGPTATFPNLSSYDLLKGSAERSRPWIDDGRMPKGTQMPQQDKDKFYSWIDAGMPKDAQSAGGNNNNNNNNGFNNGGNNGGNNGSNVTYSSGISSYIQNKCSPCHTSQSLGGVNIGNEQSAKSSAQIWVGSVLGGRMPQGSTATQQEKDMIQGWLNAGTP